LLKVERRQEKSKEMRINIWTAGLALWCDVGWRDEVGFGALWRKVLAHNDPGVRRDVYLRKRT